MRVCVKVRGESWGREVGKQKTKKIKNKNNLIEYY